MTKVTFKNEPKITGLASVGNSHGAKVKVGGKRCGTILRSSWHNAGHQVQIAIKSDDRSGFRWVMPKHTESSLSAMKEWVKANFDKLVAGHELHFFDD